MTNILTVGRNQKHKKCGLQQKFITTYIKIIKQSFIFTKGDQSIPKCLILLWN